MEVINNNLDQNNEQGINSPLTILSVYMLGFLVRFYYLSKLDVYDEQKIIFTNFLEHLRHVSRFIIICYFLI